MTGLVRRSLSWWSRRVHTALLVVLLIVWAFAFTSANARGAEPAADATLQLHLIDDGFLSGNLESSDEPNILRWKSPRFVEPFTFDLHAVSIVHFPRAAEAAKPTGEYCLELLGNDVLFGSLVGVTPEHVEFEAPPLGNIRIERAHVTRLYRWQDSADLVYLGPNGLGGWSEPENGKKWREESGQITTSEPMATIFSDLKLPPQASIEFEISWKRKPDFVLALGTSDDPRSLQRAFRFEVWEDELIVLREGTREADLASLQSLPSGGGRVQMQAFVDQQKGYIAVFSPTGKKLAELTITDEVPQLLSGIWLANKQGDVRLERLRVVRWDGQPPVEVQADKARLQRADGSIVYGQVRELDKASNEFIVLEGEQQVRIAADQVDGIFLPHAKELTPPAVRATYQDGTRISGELAKVADGAIWLKAPGVTDPVRAPLENLYSLVVLRQQHAEKSTTEGPIGQLLLPDVQLRGRLAEGEEQAGRSCLVWHPIGSLTASPLQPGLSGRIVYRERPKPIKPSEMPSYGPPMPQPQRGIVDQFLRVFTEPGTQPRASHSDYKRTLHLRTGDTIPCEVVKIDEEGVTFKSDVTQSTFIAHDRIKALELVSEPTVARIDRAKRDRLLTLPRMQRENPPTHLIRSRSGDYLRGRLVGMTDDKLQVEIRLETKELPRDRVSRILWLHDDELEPESPETAESQTRVQAVHSDGIRLTFFPKRLAGTTLSGESDVFGACQVQLEKADLLLIGSAIEENAATLAFQQWRLQNAPDPRAFVEAAGSESLGPQPGTESNLVGQPAADFTLQMLDGSTFRLEEHRGKIVVLDFWATWCGPCIRSMPEVESAVAEFKDKGVELVAVNLQENEAKISSMLERHKLNVPVALDLDGVVAEKYRVTVIPQTVIIDAQGVIARCFIGGGNQFGQNLRTGLQAVVEAAQQP